MTRGVIYMVWGDTLEPLLQRSIASVNQIHPELPVQVIRLPATTDRYRGLALKSGMFDRSPFEETLFLDADTIVLDRLDYAFDKAARFGLACCICECPWAARYLGLGDTPDIIEYNTGVLFFTKQARPVFDAWARLAPTVDSTLYFMRGGRQMVMPYNDQASFAAAVEETGFAPFVLPLNWNLRGEFTDSFFGPIKIWHAYDEVPAHLADLTAQYQSGELLIQRHEIRPK